MLYHPSIYAASDPWRRRSEGIEKRGRPLCGEKLYGTPRFWQNCCMKRNKRGARTWNLGGGSPNGERKATRHLSSALAPETEPGNEVICRRVKPNDLNKLAATVATQRGRSSQGRASLRTDGCLVYIRPVLSRSHLFLFFAIPLASPLTPNTSNPRFLSRQTL